MTDYDWFSEQNIEVAADGIRAEAKKWFGLSDRMTEVANQTAELDLAVTAFVVTDLATGLVAATDLKHAYDTMHTWLVGLFRQGAKEMDAFGEALNKIADWYEETDGRSAKSFDEIATS